MAEKEATVYIIDVGRSMGEKRHGRSVTDLEWAMQYVWDKITRTVGNGRKTALASVIALRTDETSNDLQEDDSFSNISVLFGLQQVLMPDIRKLQEAIKPSHTYHGDVISSLVLAIQMISTHCKKLKYKREIKLVTNATGLINSENLDQIREKINEEGIDLTIIGPDFDDPEYGFKEEDKDERKAQNEKLLRDFVNDCDSARVATLDEAVTQLETPEVKGVKSMVSFKGYLTLNDPGQYETAIRIPVERYYRTSIAKPPTASSFVQRAGNEGGQEDGAGGEGDTLVTVRTSRTYQIDDPTAPGGKADVERDDLAKGYEYGRTAVHISQTDENITTLLTFSGLEIIGFIPSEKFDRYLPITNAHVIIASRGDQKAGLALSSFIHALFEGESYVVARLVTKESKPPTVVLLAPYFEENFEALMEVGLPFSEDLRAYRFPPLDKVVTLSGKIIKEHRNLPSEKLQNAMDQYVDSMELDFRDENGDPAQGLPFDEFFSPLLHRIESAVRWRAVHPKDPVQAPSAALTRFSQPDEDLLSASKAQLDKLIAVAEVKKVPPKVKGSKRTREAEKPLSGLDVDALLNQEPKRAKISPDNAVPEFKQLLLRADNSDIIFDAAKQMSTIIENQVKHSLGDLNYDRVIAGLVTMREELIDFEEPAVFNEFLRSLKKKMLNEELGGDRRELWWLIRTTKLGLITHAQMERSEVSDEEAAEFLAKL